MKPGSSLPPLVPQLTIFRPLKFALATMLLTAATAVGAHAGTHTGTLAGTGTGTGTVTHAGKPIELPSSPQKTVVLDLPLLDIMAALDIPVAAVPSGRFQGSVAQYANDSIPKVGSMFEPDLDAIRAIEPDLVIAGRRGTKAYPDVAAIAPAVNLAFDQHNLVDSVMETTRTLAMIYGRQDAAEPLLDRLAESVKALQQETVRAGTGLLVFTSGGNMISQGPESRFGVLFNGYGVQPAMTDFPEGKGVPLTPELLHDVNPDWIYVLDRDASLGKTATPAQQLLADAGVDRTTAGRKGQLVYLDAFNWYMLDGAGLRGMQQNVDQLLEALKKD